MNKNCPESATSDCSEICGFFRTNCLVKIPNDVVDKDGKLLLKAGFYKSNTIKASGQVKLTDPNGSEKVIGIQRLMPAGMKRIDTNTI